MLQVSDAVHKIIRSFKIAEHKHDLPPCKELKEIVFWKSELYPEYTIKLYQPRPCYGLTLELFKGQEIIFSKPEYRTADIAECGKIILENVTK